MEVTPPPPTAGDRLARLMAVTAPLCEAVSTQQVATAILSHGLAATGACAGVIAVLDGGGAELLGLAAVGQPGEPAGVWRQPSADACKPIADAVRERRPLVFRTRREREARYPGLSFVRGSGGDGALIALPLLVRDRVVGGLRLSFPADRDFRPDEQAFVQALAYLCGQALERARLYDAERAARLEAEREAGERRRAEEQLRRQADQLAETARRQREFLAFLGHELRGPTAAITLAAQTLRASALRGPAADGAVGILERQTAHLARLLDDLLDLARVTHGRLTLRRQTVALGRVVADAVEAVRPLAEAKGHELAVALPLEPLWLDADVTRLVQAVANLLANAVRYTPPGGGRIALTAAPVGGGALLRVRDNGVGIPADMLERVFEPFTQLDTPVARAEGGLGLGLALVRELIQMHGGTVRAHSDGPGRGSEFVVILPVTAVAGPAPGEPVGAAAPRRVLVVDDNSDFAEALAEGLRRRGHDVCVACDGPSALEAAEVFRPEVAVLDMGLPGMGGREVGRRMLERPGLARVRLVALSGIGGEAEERLSREAGFHAHLIKPCRVREVEGAMGEPLPGGG